ncbi:MAG: hypothetical protein WCF99_16130 [Chloroflexales bacterium]
MRRQIRLAPTFRDTVARAELSVTRLARAAGVAESTIFHLINPAAHPERRGGMRRETAWKLANAFARLTGQNPDAAYVALIAETPAAVSDAPHD